MPQFDPTYFASQAFWLLICFGALVLIMARVIVPRIQRGLNARDRYVHDLKDKENIYLQQIDDLTQHMNQLRHDHDEKCRHMLEQAHHALRLEKEEELHLLHDHLINERREEHLRMTEEKHLIQEKIPLLAKDIAAALLHNILTKSTPHERERHHASFH